MIAGIGVGIVAIICIVVIIKATFFEEDDE